MASRSSSAIWLSFVAANLFGGELQRFEAVEPHMGSMVHIVLYAPDEDAAKRAFQSAFARVAELDGILSDYKADSELNRLCAARSAIVSIDLFRVLDASLRLASESQGAFDITAGPMIRLWREARKTGVLPDAAALRATQAHSGWRKLTLDRVTRRATLAEADMQLDVGGIAKGYVADEAVQTLKQHGIVSALVAASGDIAVSDPPPGKSGWDLTIELLGGTRDIKLRNAAVSTAGDTEQFVEIGGVRYSHIINPATGQALTTPIAVSVIAPTGLEADGLDTTISVLGVERGLELLKPHPNAKALIVTGNGARETPGFGR
ncbi:MAG TPA: FAD:protein FMN transferase [Bryobacteraceae bacterium]|jgi:thiamine biosynthesis lipoprotein